MARPAITPTTLERPFELSELFFSTTDRKGIIRSGNRVFARVSGYQEDELLGEAHNIVRHPDMPRAVFQFLWEYLERGQPIAAYVKNLARDGAHYWVLATVIPVPEGYLSVRMKPSSDLLPVVRGLYSRLVAVEQGIEGRGGTPREAMVASRAELERNLEDLGFPNYDAFMQAALPTELRSRDALLQAAGARTGRPSHATSEIDSVRIASADLRAYLLNRFRQLDRYAELSQAFDEGSQFVRTLAEDIRLFALNSQIRAARLRESGLALGVIANLMRTRSDATASEVSSMQDNVDPIVEVLQTLAFELALATLQSEMLLQFVEELGVPSSSRGLEPHTSTVATNVNALGSALSDAVGPLLKTLSDLDDRVARVGDSVNALDLELNRLHSLQVAGRVEAARLGNASDFSVLFDEVRAQISAGRDALGGFDVLESWRRDYSGGDATTSMRLYLKRIEHWVARASAAPLTAA